MENDLISRKALLDDLNGINETDYGSISDYRAHMAVGNALRDVCRIVDASPSIEAEPVRHEGNITHITTDDLDKYQGMIIVDEGEKSKFCAVYYADDREHGRWTWITEDIYRCENCGDKIHVKEVMGKPDWDYCPNCGAKMDAKEDDHA